MESPRVSVCLLVLADSAPALECLDSVESAHRDVTVETVVVANGTSPEARAPLEDRRDIVLIRCGANLGFAAGNNLAAEFAGGQFLLFLNDDSSLGPGYIDRVFATALRDDEIGAVAGTILSVDGTVQEAGSVIWSDGTAQHIGAGERDARAAFSYVRDIDYGSANGLLVRRDAWDAVGGFDERYFPAYSEDVDLCMSLRRHGYRVVYEPRAHLVHAESQSTPEGYRAFLIDRNRKLFAQKWRGDLTSFLDRPSDKDSIAIAEAIRRSNGARPSVLLVADPVRGAVRKGSSEDDAAALATDGWGVTFLQADEDRPAGPLMSVDATNRLIDLGVDVRTGTVTEVTDAVGNEFEAVVVPAGSRAQVPPIRRRDGTTVPEVPDRDNGPRGAETLAQTVSRVARRTPSEERRKASCDNSGPIKEPGRGAPVAEGIPGSGAPWRRIPPRSLDAIEADQPRRELEAANAAVRVWEEYAHTVEGYLHSKTAYIDSLRTVRIKRWVLGLLGSRTT